jgi:hypothetical protein
VKKEKKVEKKMQKVVKKEVVKAKSQKPVPAPVKDQKERHKSAPKAKKVTPKKESKPVKKRMPSFSSEKDSSEECVAPVQAKIRVDEDSSEQSELYIPVRISKKSIQKG